MPRFLPLALLAALVVAGCTSAKGVYTDGMALETAGDYSGAAHAYASALERDGSLPNVAGRLAVAGRQAVRQWVARAGDLDAEAAAQAYLDADVLVQRAARLGVDLERRPSFDADRDEVFDDAVEALLDRADADRQSGLFSQAQSRIARANAFRPTAPQRADLATLARAVYADWAEADLDAGRYRDGLAHADAALSMSPDADLADRLLALRDAIAEAGTVVAVVLPTEGGAGLTDRFLLDLDDVLVGERLSPPPPLAAFIDPADVRQWTRRHRSGPELSRSPRRLGQAATDLGADLGVVVVLGALQDQSAVGEARTETVRHGRERVEITIEPVRLTLSVEADVLASAAGQTVCDRTVTERVRTSYDRASTAGDWRGLDLSRRQRAAFADDVGQRASEDALTDLRDALAAALAGEIAECLAAQVP